MPDATVNDWGTALMTSIAGARAIFLAAVPRTASEIVPGWYARSKDTVPVSDEGLETLHQQSLDLRARRGVARTTAPRDVRGGRPA